jgi:ubiquinone/menaquinone biosynthesis C-methylase UbiE
MSKQPYSQIAQIYNDLVRHVNYEGWADYIEEIIEEYNIDDNSILELASGTGNLFINMRIPGSKIILSDISFPMLNLAPISTSKVCFDMTKIPFKKSFNLIIASFDSVNHLESVEKLNSLFSEVYRALLPNSYFLFDVVTEHNSLAYLKGFSKKRKIDNLHYRQASEYDPNTKRHKNSFIINFPDGSKIIQDHFEYIFDLKTIDLLCTSNNFTIVDKFEAFTFNSVGEDTLRVQYIIRSKT